MKQCLDERQNKIIGKITGVSFTAMYITCVAAIIIQLAFGDGTLKAVLGETVVLIVGGSAYLIGVVINGLFSTSGSFVEKNANTKVNLIGSILCSAIFSIFYGITIHKKASGNVEIEKYVVMFFVGITLLCFFVLTVLGKFSEHSQKKIERKYDDDAPEEKWMDSMKAVKLCSTKDRIEADMLINILDQHNISAYKQSVDGGIMDVYAGNSIYGEYIFVDEHDVDRAKEIVGNIRQEELL